MIFICPTTTDELIREVLSRKRHIEFSVHGLSHWQRVERNGLFIADREGGDQELVSLFALFHDSRRINDFEDPEHGARGAALAAEFFNDGKLPISQEQFDVLTFACTHHTDTFHHDNVSIQCCWDADRLDLTRVGVLPDPGLLNTETAQTVAKSMDYSEIEQFKIGQS